MQRGVVYGVLAGAMWGMVFLVPRLLTDFSPLLLSVGRYAMYGLVSVAAALPAARSLLARLTRGDLIALAKLALVGNVAYYMLLSAAVHLIGIAPSSLIVGVLPVTVTLAGLGDRGAVPLRRLAAPLALVVAGIACINVDLFTSEAAHATTLAQKLAGIACAAGALASWTWYAVANTRYLQRHHRFDGNEWSVLWGVVTGAIGALGWAVIVALPAGTVQAALPASRWHLFWLLNLGLAIGASWLGNGLWNAASKRLPLTLSGQLIVFETVFAMLYAFIFDQRMPRVLEIAALVLLLAGVYGSVRRHGDADGNGNTPTRTAIDPNAAAH
ncbi:DMT family transporter [Burkholderia multivorans]|uniref:DMT family transporter n=1 Tax=Burkholderia multivorans TaxID=87883 RepID=UPI000CFFE31D|nr:DMT family transporter [Burkholderia multivorans]MBJ9618495.1 DMT family transporter [Burkholderia multivorans]MBU9327670.1 DMT family transporter [Burkholderia multivorans]MBU9531004.1 DMT family transporter [Burkholderia multivorans]MDR8785062.1 Inner membrane protein YtfF [Burkholderia multivorans]MDR8826501.1 Inner membrane protein YtfF [Burkholderia multivorans]